jgi:hypothetical protein
MFRFQDINKVPIAMDGKFHFPFDNINALVCNPMKLDYRLCYLLSIQTN